MIESAFVREGRLLVERELNGEPQRHDPGTKVGIELDAPRCGDKRPAPARSRTVNLADSPLGWLHAHGHVSARQYAAGERLRADWERAQLDPVVTMRWDAAPIRRGRGGRASHLPGDSQLDARQRFATAVTSVGPGLADIVWRIICAGEGMRQAETALGWPARAGKLVLGLALDRIAEFYRLPGVVSGDGA